MFFLKFSFVVSVIFLLDCDFSLTLQSFFTHLAVPGCLFTLKKSKLTDQIGAFGALVYE